MARTVVHLLLTLITLIPRTLAGRALAGACQPKEPEPTRPPFPDPYPCANQLSPNERWACQDPSLQFPTVTCLAQDVIRCGNVQGKSCVFYSMGAKGIDARNFVAHDLNGRGVTFHAAVDRNYISDVMRTHLTRTARNAVNMNREDIYIRKLSQAFASVCEGDAYLMVLKRNGQGGGVGVFQTPWVADDKDPSDIRDNVWEDYEFPSLQLNMRVPGIYSVDMSNGNQPTLDWVRGRDPQTRQPADVEAIPLPP